MSGEKYGEYIELYWDSAPEFHLVRGHVDPAIGLEVLVDHGVDILEGVEPPLRIYARHAQTAWSKAEELTSQIMLYETAGRGRFMVTAYQVVGRPMDVKP